MSRRPYVGRAGGPRRSRWGRAAATFVATSLLAGCSPRGDWLDAPLPASAASDERGGHDALAVEPGGSLVRFTLAATHEIALVAVGEDGRVRPLYPLAPGESSRFVAGDHTLVVPARYEPVTVPSAPARPVAALTSEAMRAYQRCLAERRPRPSAETVAPRAPGDTSAVRPQSPERDRGTSTRYSSDTEACGHPPSSPAGPGTVVFRPQRDVVVLVVSGSPVGADQLRERALGVRVRSASDLRLLPYRIAGDTLHAAVGYYSVRFPSPRPQERQ